jgi:hypothetical protein
MMLSLGALMVTHISGAACDTKLVENVAHDQLLRKKFMAHMAHVGNYTGWCIRIESPLQAG